MGAEEGAERATGKPGPGETPWGTGRTDDCSRHFPRSGVEGTGGMG